MDLKDIGKNSAGGNKPDPNKPKLGNIADALKKNKDRPKGFNVESPSPKSNPNSYGPQPSERLDNDDKESKFRNKLSAKNKEGDSSGKKSGKERAANVAANLSEKASDVKDIAKASDASLPKDIAKEVKQSRKKAEEKGKSKTVATAGAGARETAGAAGRAGLDILTAGGLEASGLGAKVQRFISKFFKWDNLKWFVLIFASIPLMFIIIPLILFAVNPYKFAANVLLNPKNTQFTVEAAKLIGKKFIFGEKEYRRLGFVDYKDGTALAADNTPAPRPGSLEEKMTKIDIGNAVYKYKQPEGCPIRFNTKKMTKNGKVVSVIDKLLDKNNEEVSPNNYIATYCVMNSIPLYNMMFRTQKARDVNNFSGTSLNYADKEDSDNIKGKSSYEINKYVYQKTYDRITPKNDKTPKLKKEDGQSDDPNDYINQVNNYIAQVRKTLEEGGDPDLIQFPFDANNPGSEYDTLKTLCVFSKGYLSDDNISKAILSRLNAGQRSAMKTATLDSTRGVKRLPNDEMDPTFKQMDGWTASTAYRQNVYGKLSGELINPEGLGNTAYNAKFSQAISILYELQKPCNQLGSSGGISNFLGLFSFFIGQPDSNKQYKTVSELYDALRLLIVAESNGKFSKISDFGLEQLMIGVIRMGGGSAVSGLEPGPQNFNNQSQGLRALSNQYMMKIGGRFLTYEETNTLNALTENTVRNKEKNNGIAYRLFDRDNIRSVANIISYETPRTKNELGSKSKDFITAIANPIKTIADTSSGLNYVVFGERNYAVAESNNQGDKYMKLDTVGIPQADLDSVDIIKNSNEIQDIIEGSDTPQKQVVSLFEKCTKANIPTKNIFVRQYRATFDDSNDTAKVIESANNLVKVDTEIDGKKINLPKYPAINGNYESLGLSSKKDVIACEIYFLNDKYTDRDYPAQIQNELFGFKINDLARKYRVYLYSNTIADLLVELSSTEYTDKIYANPPGGKASTDDASASGSGIIGDIGLNSDTIPCPEGTSDVGVVEGAYTGSVKKESGPLKVRLCRVPEIPGRGENSQGVKSEEGAVFNSRVAGAFRALGIKAKKDGVPIVSTSSFRLKQPCKQSSSCAAQGSSFHQLGVALDVGAIWDSVGGNANNATTCANRQTSNTKEWQWLKDNAESFGIKQLAHEAWHWEATGKANTCGK